MSLVDKPFKEALRGLPQKKLSWLADRAIKKSLRYRAAELDGRSIWFGDFMKQLVAVPLALVVLFSSIGSYAYYSPTVVSGDFLYAVKDKIELSRYPSEGSSEDRIAYHLFLSERRYAEVNEILKRLGKGPVSLIPAAMAASESVDLKLNRILFETLQNATQNVDYAFLITKEIRDVERVKKVKEKISGTLKKQKVFVKRIRGKGSEGSDENSEMVRTEQNVQDDQNVVVENFEVKLAVQDNLIEKIDELIVQADIEGMMVVRLTELVKRDEVSEIKNNLFNEALAVHYKNSKSVLEAELEELVAGGEGDVDSGDSGMIETEVTEGSEGSEGSEGNNGNKGSNGNKEIEDATVTAEATEIAEDAQATQATEPTVAIEAGEVDEATEVDEVDEPDDADEGNEAIVDIEADEAKEADEKKREIKEVMEITGIRNELVGARETELTECEIKAEEKCANSDQENCTEKLKNECDERLKQVEENDEKLSELNKKTERVKRELEEVELKLEELNGNK